MSVGLTESLKGCSSLGRLRYAALLRIGQGKSSGLCLVDVKEGVTAAAPSAAKVEMSRDNALILVRVDDRRRGRGLVRRLIPAGVGPKRRSWAALALTFEGRRALGVPEESLASFLVEFGEGMAARAEILGDADEGAPEHLEAPIARGSRPHGNPRQNGFAKGIRVGRSMVAWLAAVSALIWLLPCDGLAAEALELKFDGMRGESDSVRAWPTCRAGGRLVRVGCRRLQDRCERSSIRARRGARSSEVRPRMGRHANRS